MQWRGTDLSLGETISDANIAVDGSTDAILVGRVNKVDTFTVRDADTGANDTADLYLVDFDASVDSLDFSAYARYGTDPADYADGLRNHGDLYDGTTVDYDVYIVGTYTRRWMKSCARSVTPSSDRAERIWSLLRRYVVQEQAIRVNPILTIRSDARPVLGLFGLSGVFLWRNDIELTPKPGPPVRITIDDHWPAYLPVSPE